MALYACVNLGTVGELSLATQNSVLKTISETPNLHVICAVEAHKSTALAGWVKHGTVGEVIFVRRTERVLNSGWRYCALSTQGYRIRMRVFRWVMVFDEDIQRYVRPVATHMPPRRMTRLRPIYARRLRAYMRELMGSSALAMVGGDWNEYITNDPYGMHKLLGYRWFAQRIDGWAVEPECFKFVKQHSFKLLPPSRRDGHQTTIVKLGK